MRTNAPRPTPPTDDDGSERPSRSGRPARHRSTGVLFVIFVVAVATVTPFVAPAEAQSPLVSVVDFRVTPSEPSAGEPVTMTATVQNSDRSEFGFEITRVEVRDVSGIDEKVLAGQSDVGTLGPGDSTILSQTVRFREPGIKQLTFIIYGTSTGRGGGSTIKYPVTIVVEETEPRIDTTYSDLLVGADNNFTVTVSNGKSTSVRDVRVSLSGAGFAAKESSKSAAVIGSGESLPFTFLLTSEASGLRTVRIDLSFTASGVTYSLVETQDVFFREPGEKVATVTEFTQSPERVAPGEAFQLAFLVRNRGETTLRDLSFSLDLTGTSLRAGRTGTDLYVEEVRPGDGQRISYQLKASESAPSGIVTVPLAYRFTTDDGSVVTEQTTLSVEVLGDPELRTFVRRVVDRDGGYSVTVDVANVGNGVARSARIDLGESSYFLGDIDAGDFETATLRVDRGGEFVAVLTYKNGFNEPLVTEQSVFLPVQSGTRNVSLWLLGGVGILVVAGALWWYRWRK